MKRSFRNFVIILALAVSGCATMPHRDSVIGDWQVMVKNPGKKTMMCYAGASPAQSAGSLGSINRHPWLMATRRQSGKIEMSASIGTALMPGSKAQLMADDESYSLFFEKDVAWARDDAEDKAIIAAIKSASDIKVMGMATGRLTVTDTYSTAGFAAAIARIRELCP